MTSSKIIIDNPLGKTVKYGSLYQPSLLFPIARQEKRDELGLGGGIPFDGEDIWNAYELSWLNTKGVPQVGIGEFRFAASSPNIVESKSLKLYLNSLNQSSFTDINKYQDLVRADLERAAGGSVTVKIRSLDDEGAHDIRKIDTICIDSLDIEIDQYDYQPELLQLEGGSGLSNNISEYLCSHLLKSNCLITNQPDWASVFVQYKGAKISHASLLKYLVSFRTHNEFHEQCVERIFSDILRICRPLELTVYARYTRRGGLDINPWRSNYLKSMENNRLSRQ